jgi:hypothetical protein
VSGSQSLDLDVAKRCLVESPNILAANHLQQAAETSVGGRTALFH